jgi:hypothetical protein
MPARRRLDFLWGTTMTVRMQTRLALATIMLIWPLAAVAAEPVRQIGIYVQPYYESARTPGERPRVSVGQQYNELLSSNRR